MESFPNKTDSGCRLDIKQRGDDNIVTTIGTAVDALLIYLSFMGHNQNRQQTYYTLGDDGEDRVKACSLLRCVTLRYLARSAKRKKLAVESREDINNMSVQPWRRTELEDL